MSRKREILLRVDRRELATILAALRFHKDENLQGGRVITDLVIADIATEGGTLKPLDARGIDKLCRRLNRNSEPAVTLSPWAALVGIAESRRFSVRANDDSQTYYVNAHGKIPARGDSDGMVTHDTIADELTEQEADALCRELNEIGSRLDAVLKALGSRVQSRITI